VRVEKDGSVVFDEEKLVLDQIVARSDLYSSDHLKYAVHRCKEIPRIDYLIGGNSYMALMPSNINLIRRLCDDVEAQAKRQKWKISK